MNKKSKPKGNSGKPTNDEKIKPRRYIRHPHEYRLSPTEEKFADEYLLDLNATRAYLRVSPHVSRGVATTCGSKLLTYKRVRLAIRHKLRKAWIDVFGDDAYLDIVQGPRLEIRVLQAIREVLIERGEIPSARAAFVEIEQLRRVEEKRRDEQPDKIHVYFVDDDE
jgi:hypothetical protein